MVILVIKRINKLKADSVIWTNDGERTLEHPYYDGQKRALCNWIEYDDDYGGGYYEDEYPLSEYGKTWALTAKEMI